LGQIEDASFRRFRGTRLEAAPVGSSDIRGTIVEFDKLPVEFSLEFMSGVVAQIELRENMNVLASQCEPRCEESARFDTSR
jgi:hypothetical protein